METLVKQQEIAVGKTFKLKGKIMANPDKHQYFKPMTLELEGLTLADLKARQRQFIDESFTGISSEIPIGGGNWATRKTKVVDPNGKVLGTMSYNGTIIDKNGHEVIV